MKEPDQSWPSGFSGAKSSAPVEISEGRAPPDCWNVIGIGGNGSCRELEKFVHCRNCPVYTAAAMELLNRPITPANRREWTEHYAREKRMTAPARLSVVIFRIGSEWLALPTTVFQEVAERRPVHTLPHRRRGVVLGLVNVRGELLICVSLTRVLGLTDTRNPKELKELKSQKPGSGTGTTFISRSGTLDSRLAARLLVARWEGGRYAFPVEEVPGIHRLPQEELRSAPATVARAMGSHIEGIFAWREYTVGLMAPELLFGALNRSLG